MPPRKLKRLDPKQPTLTQVPKCAPVVTPPPVKKIEDEEIVDWMNKVYIILMRKWAENLDPDWKRKNYFAYARYARDYARDGFTQESEEILEIIKEYRPVY